MGGNCKDAEQKVSCVIGSCSLKALQSSEGEGLDEKKEPLSCDLSNGGTILGDQIEP